MLSNPNSQKTNKTPTVLFISHDYHFGGAGKSLLLAIKNIKSIRPIAACIQDGRFIEECKKAGIETQVFHRKFVYHKNKCLLRIGHLWEDLICFAKCWQFVKKKRIDLIHINSAMSFLVVFGIVGWLRRIPVVWHLRDIPRVYWVQRLINFMVARFSSAIVCVSKAVRDRFASTTQGSFRTEVILNPLDPGELPSLPNIVGDKVVFGMPGQIAEWKRHKLFLEAALHVCKVCKDARFLIIGKPLPGFTHLLEELKDYVKLNQLRDVVEFEDWKFEMTEIYERINVIVNASKEEPLARTLIEGMALERPAIAFRSGGSVDIVEDYVDGLLVDEDSAEDLAKAMIYFLEERGRVERMGKAARINVARKFAVEKHVKSMEVLFWELLKYKVYRSINY